MSGATIEHRTKMRSIEYVWKIEHFKLYGDRSGEVIESSKFSIPNDLILWWLELKVYDYTDRMGLYLFCDADGGISKPVPKTKCTLSFINARGQKTHSHTYHAPDGALGSPNFCSRSNIISGKSSLLSHNDTLTILCELVVKSGNNTVEREETVEVACSKVSRDYGNLFTSERCSDVTICVRSKKFYVHKAVLIARSPVFEAMFSHQMSESQKHIVNIEDMSPHVFKKMLEFIYTDEAPGIQGKIALNLLMAADKYDLERLKNLCEKALSTEITVENAVNMIMLADQYNAGQLVQCIVSFFSKHANQVMNTPEFTPMSKSHPHLILRLIHAGSPLLIC